MKRFLSANYNDAGFNFSMLLLRFVFGLFILLKHGIPKITNFSTLQNTFYSFIGLGSKISLMLAISAEVVCALFIMLGLFTRLTVIPLIITMLVAIFGANAGKPLLQAETPILYLTAFVVLLFCGPGKLSVDRMINR